MNQDHQCTPEATCCRQLEATENQALSTSLRQWTVSTLVALSVLSTSSLPAQPAMGRPVVQANSKGTIITSINGPGAVGIIRNSAKYETIHTTASATLDEKGNARFTMLMIFPTEAIYSDTKKEYPNAYVLIRDMIGANRTYEMADPQVEYRDSKRTIAVTGNWRGAAVCSNGRWHIKAAGKDSQLIKYESNEVMFNDFISLGNGFVNQMVLSLRLPGTSFNGRSEADGQFSFEMPRKVSVGQPRLELQTKTKDNLISSLYKVYGNPAFQSGGTWLARSVFANTGTGDVLDLKISYRLGEYADWSVANSYDVVVAGGAVVDFYYPIVKKAVTELRNVTPAELEVKYTYKNAEGKVVETVQGQRLNILGINQFEFAALPRDEQTSAWKDQFSNAPLLPAYVTKADEPVRDLAGRVAQMCGGTAASTSDEGAYTYCKTLYELLALNHLSYSTPGGFLNENKGFGQDIKFPREVLREKSGTCVDLAILFAAVCESQGLKTSLVLVPDHCFPVIKLPESGNLLSIEATCLGGSAVGAATPFTNAVAVGHKEYSEHVSNGNWRHHFLINVAEQQANGAMSPELPKLSDNPLAAWGWVFPADVNAVSVSGSQVNVIHVEANATVMLPPPAPQEIPAPAATRAAKNHEVEALCAILKSEDAGDMIRALKKLRGMNAPEAVPMILPCLDTRFHPNVIRDACRTLAVLGNKDVIPYIEPLLSHRKADVRKDAQDAIAKLKTKA